MRLPDLEHQTVPDEMIERAITLLNEHHEAAFGVTAGTYNFHIVASHIREIRAHGPLTDNTAYPFEGLYADLRRSFVPGTRSINS